MPTLHSTSMCILSATIGLLLIKTVYLVFDSIVFWCWNYNSTFQHIFYEMYFVYSKAYCDKLLCTL